MLSGPTEPRFITGIGTLALPNLSSGGLPTPPVIYKHSVWMELSEGRISYISAQNERLPDGSTDKNTFDVGGRLVTPGFVDAHTHPAFVDFRIGEFESRLKGESYLQIAARGGGILYTVRGLRAIEEGDLSRLIEERFRRFLQLGTTTIEAKSGYGLTVQDELKSLRAIKCAARTVGIDCSPTLLGAHTIPPEYENDPDGYVKLITDEMIPVAVHEGLTEAVDVFVEKSAFTVNQARTIFEAGRNWGLKLRIHTDQFTSLGGVNLAVEYNAASVDHCDFVGDNDLKSLSNHHIPIVLLPGAVFFLRLENYAKARRMVDEGCLIALSTDFNPGSSPTQSMPMMMTLACLKMGLTPAEALWAATQGGAYALGREDIVGNLQVGYQADFCVWEANDINFIPYVFGSQAPIAVLKKGIRVV